ncbi:MAG TPA: hypothetical protein VHE53_02595 [Patescibacteria group bacterium]|nr:hypothetical protein [Patescibacteria group bacterium]
MREAEESHGSTNKIWTDSIRPIIFSIIALGILLVTAHSGGSVFYFLAKILVLVVAICCIGGFIIGLLERKKANHVPAPPKKKREIKQPRFWFDISDELAKNIAFAALSAIAIIYVLIKFGSA